MVREHIEEAHKIFNSLSDRGIGCTIFVWCGSSAVQINFKEFSTDIPWSISMLPAHDLYTLFCDRNFDFASLFQIYKIVNKYTEFGVKLFDEYDLFKFISLQSPANSGFTEVLYQQKLFSDDDPLVFIDPTVVRDYRLYVNKCFDKIVAKSHTGENTHFFLLESSPMDEMTVVKAYKALRVFDQATPALVVGQQNIWWMNLQVDGKIDLTTYMIFWEMCAFWMKRILYSFECLNIKTIKYSLFVNIMAQIDALNPNVLEDIVPDFDYRISHHVCDDTINIYFPSWFSTVSFSSGNLAESQFVKSLICGVLKCQNIYSKSLATDLYNHVVPVNSVKFIHYYPLLDDIRSLFDGLSNNFIEPNLCDEQLVNAGMAWRALDTRQKHDIFGKDNCVKFLNKIVLNLETELINKLQSFSLKYYMEAVLDNHELVCSNRQFLKQTSTSSLSFFEDIDNSQRIVDTTAFKYSTIIAASRVLLEIGQQECSTDLHAKPRRLDIAEHLALASEIMRLGAVSDSIYYGSEQPTITVSSLGQVSIYSDFFGDTYNPFVTDILRNSYSMTARGYQNTLERQENSGSSSLHSDEFFNALEDELGISQMEIGEIFVALCEVCFKQKLQYSVFSKSIITDMIHQESGVDLYSIKTFLNTTILPKRKSWRTIPDGFIDRDRQPWKMKRRLSLLRRPILQLSNCKDPDILVVPSLVGDWIDNTLQNYHDANFPIKQIRSKRMRNWWHKVHGGKGKFNKVVAKELQNFGWEVRANVHFSEILKCDNDSKFGDLKHYGDIDVLAWNNCTKRVLIIECKDMQKNFATGDLASQLQKFRGIINESGDRDEIRKHLDRLDVCSARISEIGKFISIENPKIEGIMVFKNPFPVEKISESWKHRIRVVCFSQIHLI